MNKALQIIGGIVVTVAVAGFSIALNGWVLSIIWQWFIVTTFRAPRLSVPAAIGLALVVRYATWTATEETNKTAWGATLLIGVARTVVVAAFTLAIGWIVHLFLGA